MKYELDYRKVGNGAVLAFWAITPKGNRRPMPTVPPVYKLDRDQPVSEFLQESSVRLATAAQASVELGK